MTTRAQIAQLLVVQKRRVEQAMTLLKTRNEQLRQRQLQRNDAFDHWTAADVASRDQQQSQIRVVSENLGHGIGAGNLTVVARRREWLRARVDENWQVLTNAEAELAQARTAAMEARTAYQQACNRQEALIAFGARLRSAEMKKEARSEEGTVEDVLTNRYANGR
jgi:hypothetical protein